MNEAAASKSASVRNAICREKSNVEMRQENVCAGQENGSLVNRCAVKNDIQAAKSKETSSIAVAIPNAIIYCTFHLARYLRIIRSYP